jgi:hypothetical protein
MGAVPSRSTRSLGSTNGISMHHVSVQITKFVDRDPQPGIVECQLVDAFGKIWTFVDKSAIFSNEALDESNSYPRPGVIRCELLSRGIDDRGQDVVEIDTAHPDSVESIGGEHRFVVRGSLVMEPQGAA